MVLKAGHQGWTKTGQLVGHNQIVNQKKKKKQENKKLGLP